MARQTTKTPVANDAASAPLEATVQSITPRKTTVPRASKPKVEASTNGASAASSVPTPTPVTWERIAEHAYFRSQSGIGGSELDHWLAAERELNGQ